MRHGVISKKESGAFQKQEGKESESSFHQKAQSQFEGVFLLNKNDPKALATRMEELKQLSGEAIARLQKNLPEDVQLHVGALRTFVLSTYFISPNEPPVSVLHGLIVEGVVTQLGQEQFDTHADGLHEVITALTLQLQHERFIKVSQDEELIQKEGLDTFKEVPESLRMTKETLHGFKDFSSGIPFVFADVRTALNRKSIGLQRAETTKVQRGEGAPTSEDFEEGKELAEDERESIKKEILQTIRDEGFNPEDVAIAWQVYKTYLDLQAEIENNPEIQEGEEQDHFNQRFGDFIDRIAPPNTAPVGDHIVASFERLWERLKYANVVIPDSQEIGLPEQSASDRKLFVNRVRMHWLENDRAFLDDANIDQEKQDQYRELHEFWSERLPQAFILTEDDPDGFRAAVEAQVKMLTAGSETILAAEKVFGKTLVDNYLSLYNHGNPHLSKETGLSSLGKTEEVEVLRQAEWITEEVEHTISDFTQLVDNQAIIERPVQDLQELNRFIYEYAGARVEEDRFLVQLSEAQDRLKQLQGELPKAREKEKAMREVRDTIGVSYSAVMKVELERLRLENEKKQLEEEVLPDLREKYFQAHKQREERGEGV